MEHKVSVLSSVKVVDSAAGVVEAFTNSMGVVDADLDIIEPTAFDSSIAKNLPISVLVGHDPNNVVGKVISAQAIEGDDGTARLYNRIQFNLDTQAGRDSFSNIAGDFVRAWSVGFNIPEGGVEMDRMDGTAIRRIKDLDWVEVSSVLRGASPDTATISAKSDGSGEAPDAERVIPPHDAATAQAAWDGRAATRRLNGDDATAYAEAFAYFSSGEDPNSKGSYKFIHHEIERNGIVGAANVAACIAGIGALNGARGGTTIPGSDRLGVWEHLAKHLRDGGFEPPELKDALPDAMAADTAAEGQGGRALGAVGADAGIAARLLAARLRYAKHIIDRGLEYRR